MRLNVYLGNFFGSNFLDKLVQLEHFSNLITNTNAFEWMCGGVHFGWCVSMIRFLPRYDEYECPCRRYEWTVPREGQLIDKF